jgi:5-methyltetrahydrofolate corrinoid/iron sulfur protein methyltransferase
MIIIGEKINGFIPSTLEAIEKRDEEYIRYLAKGQSEAGATFIDVCAGTAAEVERETMEWLINLVQEATDTPLCIDSSDPQIIVDLLPMVNQVGCINSISMEEGKCETILPAIAGTEWSVVALTCDMNGIPDDPQEKFNIACQIVERADDAGVARDKLLIDPLVTTLATNQDSMMSFIEAEQMILDKFPDVHITSGLSNISYGMPYRKIVNMGFLMLAMEHGMDSAIINPMSEDMLAMMYATEALLGRDKRCKKYLKAYRKGLFGGKKA